MNVYKAAREAFGLATKSGARGQVDPYRLGRVLAAANQRGTNPQVVKAQLRPLRLNPETGRLEEKGVDVALAACAFEWAVIERVDRVVIVSHDTDLSSIVEVIARTKGPEAVETASWCSDGYRKRIPPIPGVTNHLLREKLFRAIEDRTHYGHEARRRLTERASLFV